jgi:hypothetical protein
MEQGRSIPHEHPELTAPAATRGDEAPVAGLGLGRPLRGGGGRGQKLDGHGCGQSHAHHGLDEGAAAQSTAPDFPDQPVDDPLASHARRSLMVARLG